jgi:hypothetical protein
MEEEVPLQPGQLNIVVRDMQNNEIHFKLKSSAKMEKLMNVYCARQGKNPKATRFFFDGERVLPESTPESLEMSDGDMLEVHEEQLGGRWEIRLDLGAE